MSMQSEQNEWPERAVVGRSMTTGVGVGLAASLAASLLVLASAGMTGCASPMAGLDDTRLEMREAVLTSYRDRLKEFGAETQVDVTREASDVEEELTDERRRELDRISGVSAYSTDPLRLGPGLTESQSDAMSSFTPGQLPPEVDEIEQTGVANPDRQVDEDVMHLSLQEAIEKSLLANLDINIARIQPAISEQDILRAEAVFDTVLFANIDWASQDTPGVATPGFAAQGGDQQSETLSLQAGIRQQFSTGAALEVTTGIQRNSFNPSSIAVNEFWSSDLTASVTQPLLRGAGQDVNRAQIKLSRNAQDAEVQQYRGQLIELVAAVEEAYWNLLVAKQTLLIQNRLLQRTVDDRDKLVKRRDFDVSPVRITEANSFVELRRADVIRARQNVRVASDQLKRLINTKDARLSDEVLVLPTTNPIEEPISFSLLDTVSTALQERPDMQIALFAIKDADIRLIVAENAKLPILDLSASIGLNAANRADRGEYPYRGLTDLDYIDYALGLAFEYPWGNRDAVAAFEQATLQRTSSLLDYQRVAQDVTLEVKNALRQVVTSYELIGAARAARRAAADSLRAIQEQEEAGEALTAEFLLDLKLQTQARLADAETQEIQSMTDYNIAISELYRSMGTLLQQYGIDFRDYEYGQDE